MTQIEFFMDGSLARAARHLVKVSVKTIAQYAGIKRKALRQYEKGASSLTTDELQSVVDALTHYGAVFVPEDGSGGVGVRRKFTRTGIRMIETWEAEGGPARSDDG